MGIGEGKGLKYSKMEISIRVSGREISQMEREHFGIKMATDILGSGSMAKLMDMESILLLMGLLTRAIG